MRNLPPSAALPAFRAHPRPESLAHSSAFDHPQAEPGDTTTDDSLDLRQAQYPLLAQLADQNTCQLLELFGGLPDSTFTALQRAGYVKWQVCDLDARRRHMLEDLNRVNIDMATQQGVPENPAYSIEAFSRAETGFAIVSIPETQQKVASWFVLGPELPDPTWVTVVNTRATATPEYFRAHLRELPSLRALPASGVPAG